MILQRLVQSLKKIVPRGLSPLLKLVAKIYPKARRYPANLINGDKIILDLSQSMCHPYFYYGGLQHESFTDELFKVYLRPGDVILDIGANVGYYTRLVSKLVGNTGKVYAFEPMPAAIRILKMNIEDLDNVILHEVAVSNKKGFDKFTVRVKGATSSLGDDKNSAEVITVSTNTIDNMLSGINKIDMIKIDVEGYEYEVLEGAIETIRETKPLIYFEYIDNYVAERGVTLEKFKSLLQPLGYSFSWMNQKFPNLSLTSETPSNYVIAATNNDRWVSLMSK